MSTPNEVPPPEPSGAEQPIQKKSSLPEMGCLVMLLAMGLPALLALLIGPLGDGTDRLTGLQRVLLIATDLLRAALFVGLAMLIIGLMRNRKRKG